MDMAVGVDKDTAKNDAADYAIAIDMFNFAIAHGHDGVRKEALAKLDQMKLAHPKLFKTDKEKNKPAAPAAAGSVTPAK